MTAYTLPIAIQTAIKTTYHAHLDANRGGISSTLSIAEEIKSATGSRRNEIATAVFNAYRQEYAEASTSLTKAEQTAAGSAWNACRKNLDTNLKSRFLVCEWPAIKTGNRKDGSRGCLVHDAAAYESQKTREAEEAAKEIDQLAATNKANRASAELQAWREKTPYEAAMDLIGQIDAYGADDAQAALVAILTDRYALSPYDFRVKYTPSEVEHVELPDVMPMSDADMAELKAMLANGQITDTEYQAMAA